MALNERVMVVAFPQMSAHFSAAIEKCADKKLGMDFGKIAAAFDKLGEVTATALEKGRLEYVDTAHRNNAIETITAISERLKDNAEFKAVMEGANEIVNKTSAELKRPAVYDAAPRPA